MTAVAGSVAARLSMPDGRRGSVVIVTHETEWGGMEVHSEELALALVAAGWSVSIVQINHTVYSSRPRLREAGVACHSVTLEAGTNAAGLWETRAVLGRFPADLCIFARSGMCRGNLRFVLALRALYRRFILIEHSLPLPRPVRAGGQPWHRGWALWWQWGRLGVAAQLALTDLTICVSDAVRGGYVHDYFASARRTVTVRNGIDTSLYRFDSEARADVRGAWGVPDGALVMGCIGRVWFSQKGQDLCLRVFRAVRRLVPDRDLRFVVIGDGPDLPALRQMAAGMKLEEVTHFAGSSDTPWREHTALDVFMLASPIEGFGLALAEAMATERICVAYEVGGVGELLAEPCPGFLVAAGDKAGLLRAVCKAVRMTDTERKALGRAARARVSERFRLEVQMGALVHQLLRTTAP